MQRNIPIAVPVRLGPAMSASREQAGKNSGHPPDHILGPTRSRIVQLLDPICHSSLSSSLGKDPTSFVSKRNVHGTCCWNAGNDSLELEGPASGKSISSPPASALELSMSMHKVHRELLRRTCSTALLMKSVGSATCRLRLKNLGARFSSCEAFYRNAGFAGTGR